MTKRWIILGAAVAALLAATVGITYAAGGRGSSPAPSSRQLWAASEAMHHSPAMRAMHEQMPAALQARCEAMHEWMDQMMGSSAMMGGSTLMGSSMTAGGSTADHHLPTEG